MNDAKYIGLDVHQAMISVAVLDSTGKLVMECTPGTKAATLLQFFRGLRGSLLPASRILNAKQCSRREANFRILPP
jgi:hypothetical protein